MQSCELVATITAIACAIANSCSEDEINVLAAVFNQLGDTLATILAQESCNNDQKDSNKDQGDSNTDSQSTKKYQTDCNKDVED